MGFGRWLGRVAKALAAPVLLFSLAGFFVWHATHGERGLAAREERLAALEVARRAQQEALAEREAAERRVNALRGQALDRDQLEERARAMLNLTTREEIVVPYPAGQRLY
jgi:cell division protein FtsB